MIVNIASVAGMVAFPERSAYSISKGAVVMLTKSIAVDYAAQGIRCNAVCPGIIQTPMVDRMMAGTGIVPQNLIDQEPIGRLGQPGEIGEAVIWLLSDLSSFVTGIAMPVDGGYVAP